MDSLRGNIHHHLRWYAKGVAVIVGRLCRICGSSITRKAKHGLCRDCWFEFASAKADLENEWNENFKGAVCSCGNDMDPRAKECRACYNKNKRWEKNFDGKRVAPPRGMRPLTMWK